MKGDGCSLFCSYISIELTIFKISCRENCELALLGRT